MYTRLSSTLCFPISQSILLIQNRFICIYINTRIIYFHAHIIINLCNFLSRHDNITESQKNKVEIMYVDLFQASIYISL